MRPDPLRDHRPVSGKRRTRFTASSLRGFQLLRKGIFPSARMIATSAQTIPSAVAAKLLFDTSVVDRGADDGGDHADAKIVDLTNNRLIIRHAGIYTVTMTVIWPSNATGHRILRLYKNGSQIDLDTRNAVSGTNSVGRLVTMQSFVVDDYLEAFVTQTSGDDLDSLAAASAPSLTCVWVGL